MKTGTCKQHEKNSEICYTLVECFLGTVLIARSAKGICAIWIGDNPDSLLEKLQVRFSDTCLVDDASAFEQEVAQVISLIENPEAACALPLDMKGTTFQTHVWNVLQTIPVGQTMSYAEVASLIGNPKAVRAVARACAQNNIAVAIPCHRVIRQDGGLSGYRWGVERKRRLLEKEAEHAM